MRKGRNIKMRDPLLDNLEKIAVHPMKLRRLDERIQTEQKYWYELLQPVFNELEAIPYALIKGQVLSVLAYGDTGYRDSKDIDILVSRSDLTYVDNVLRKNGFDSIILDEHGKPKKLTRAEKIMILNSHQVTPYTKPIGSGRKALELDINVDIYGAEYSGPRIDITEFLSDTIKIEVFGQNIKTLSFLKTFIAVIMHHYREMNAPYIFKVCNPLTTRMFQDVYCLFKRYIEKDIEALVNYSEKNALHKYIYYMLYYTNLVFPDKELNKSLDYFKTAEGVEILSSYGLTDGERKKWKSDFYDRLDVTEIYSLIEADLTQRDKEKIEAVWNII